VTCERTSKLLVEGCRQLGVLVYWLHQVWRAVRKHDIRNLHLTCSPYDKRQGCISLDDQASVAISTSSLSRRMQKTADLSISAAAPSCTRKSNECWTSVGAPHLQLAALRCAPAAAALQRWQGCRLPVWRCACRSGARLYTPQLLALPAVRMPGDHVSLPPAKHTSHYSQMQLSMSGSAVNCTTGQA
jgi:hypothetical protein